MTTSASTLRSAVTIVDYGMGNVFSVRRAFEHCGADVCLSADPDRVLDATRLVLPGVGAFADGMRELRDRGLIDPLRRYAERGLPFLGICLGMQMMLDTSDEFGHHEGLGLLPGRVRAIPTASPEGRRHKVPHIGWSDLRKPDPSRAWTASVLDGVKEGSPMYFVHSYTAHPDDDRCRLADCDYDGVRISAVIRRGNLYGCQFHPEKSGERGLTVIRNFLAERAD